ncbi:MAG: ATP-binding protein [Cellulosilyticaceae bacterium]
MYQIFECIHDSICVLNKEQKIIFCNNAFLNHLKYEDLVGQSLAEIILPNQKWLSERETSLNKTILTLKSHSGDALLFCVDQVDSTINGQPVHVLILHPYEDSYYTKQDLENLLDYLPFHIWTKNTHSEYTYINQKYAQWISPNQNKQEILGQLECLYWNEDLISYFNRTDQQVLEFNKAIIIPEVLTINDSTVHWQTHKIPISSHSDKIDSILGLTTMTNDSNQVEVSLAHANRQLNMLYDITKSPVTDLNSHNILQHLSTLIGQYLTACALCIFEYDSLSKDLVSRAVYGDFSTIFPIQTRIQLDEKALNMIMSFSDSVCVLDISQITSSVPFYNFLIDTFKAHDINHFCSYLIKEDTELLGVVWVGYPHTYEPISVQDNFIQTLCSQIHSIIKNTSLIQKAQSERKKRELAEAQALQLEKAMTIESMKNEFFTNISHELKTPINILLSTNDLLNYFYENNMISTSSDVNFSKYTGIIKQNSYRLLRLIGNLIDITKIEAGEYPLQLGLYNIVNIIEETTLSIKDYIESKSLHLLFDTDIEECFIPCDAEHIERIMLNLLSNAVKYSHSDDEIYVSITHTSTLLRVCVKDTGIGIPSDKLDFIFQRFGQVHTTLSRPAEGSGIGLSLVYALVEMHGGHIKVESTLDVGSTFTFELPITTSHSISEAISKPTSSVCSLSKNSIESCHIEFSDVYC